MKVLEKTQLEKLFNTGATVYGPKSKGEDVEYVKVSSPDEITFDFYNSRVPPKTVSFPQNEKMFDIEPDGELKDVFVEEDKIWLFGIRPCDAKAYTYMDALFNWDGFEDPYYNKRREAMTVFVLGCLSQPADAFCTSFEGGGPRSREGADVFMLETDDKLFLEGVTDKGRAALDELGLADADQAEVDKAEEIDEGDARSLDLDGLPEALDNKWDEEFWERVGQNCLSCGICTFLCPSCHCFDVNDTFKKGKGARCRVWDTCQFSHYTMHAGGHNPRPEKMNRVRNRLMHKFNFIPKNFDTFGCVGCGRCISLCPVNIDIVEILKEVGQ